MANSRGFTLTGKVGLVTGGARGIGKAIAEALLQRRAKVCLIDVLKDAGEATESEFKKTYGDGSVMFIVVDVTDSDALKSAFQKTVDTFGGLDVVVNNAGVVREDQWSKMLDINLKAVIEGTFIATDIMRKDKGGRGGVIIQTASMHGVNPFRFMPVYSAGKHGVVGFTKSWALNPDVKHNGVRVNAFFPGLVDTDIANFPDDYIYHAKECRAFHDTLVEMSPAYVAEGMMTLIKEPLTGAILNIGLDLLAPGERLHTS